MMDYLRTLSGHWMIKCEVCSNEDTRQYNRRVKHVYKGYQFVLRYVGTWCDKCCVGAIHDSDNERQRMRMYEIQRKVDYMV